MCDHCDTGFGQGDEIWSYDKYCFCSVKCRDKYRKLYLYDQMLDTLKQIVIKLDSVNNT